MGKGRRGAQRGIVVSWEGLVEKLKLIHGGMESGYRIKGFVFRPLQGQSVGVEQKLSIYPGQTQGGRSTSVWPKDTSVRSDWPVFHEDKGRWVR